MYKQSKTKMLASKQSVRPFVAQRSAPHRLTVVAMAKPVKAKDMRPMSDEELTTKVASLKKELASVKFLQRTRGVAEFKAGEAQQSQPDPEKVPKGHMNKHIRTQIAVALTVMRERQVAAGISKRQSRNLDRKGKVESGAAL